MAKQEPLVEMMRERFEEAESRYEKFAGENIEEIPRTEILLKPLEFAVKVQEVRIEQAYLAITKLVLRAPACGKVETILRRPGEFVAMGQPVVSIVDPRSVEVVAYLPEARILHIEEGASVTLRRKADPEEFFPSTVAHLSSSVQQLPARLTPGALTPSWGLAVHIPVPETLEVKPGEAIEVRF